jgi:hypothetical protein
MPLRTVVRATGFTPSTSRIGVGTVANNEHRSGAKVLDSDLVYVDASIVAERGEDLAKSHRSFVGLAAGAITCHFQRPYLSPTCHLKTPLSINVYRPPVTLSPPHTPLDPPPANVLLVRPLISDGSHFAKSASPRFSAGRWR